MSAEGDARELKEAEMFLAEYNARTGHSFKVVERRPPPEPDILCLDMISNDRLRLEMTSCQSGRYDIANLLGHRSDHSIDRMRSDDPLCLQQTGDDWSADVVRAIARKSLNDYGQEVALIIRDASPVPWDLYVDEIRQKTPNAKDRFDRGIWLLRPFENSLDRIW